MSDAADFRKVKGACPMGCGDTLFSRFGPLGRDTAFVKPATTGADDA